MKEENDKVKRIRQKYIGTTYKESKAEVKKRRDSGKTVSKEEKASIIASIGKKVKRRLPALILAGTIGFGPLALASCTDKSEQYEPSSGTGRQTFVESLVVEPEELLTETDQIKEDIASLKNKDQVLQFLKETYANEYEEIIGDKISVSNLKILSSSQDYMYKIASGDYVSHGNSPSVTEYNIINSGEQIVDGDNKKDTMYRVLLNDEVIDAFVQVYDEDGKLENKKVIPGDNYLEMKDYTSVLTELGDVTVEAFKLMDLMGQLEKDSGNGYLKEKISLSKERLKSDIANLDNQEQSIEDGGR